MAFIGALLDLGRDLDLDRRFVGGSLGSSRRTVPSASAVGMSRSGVEERADAMRRIPVRAVQTVGLLGVVVVGLWLATWLVRNF
jgi:hypothetical protein